jgi:endoglucanase
VSDGKGGSGQASVTITATGSNSCKFGTPRTSALAAIMGQYNHVYVLGSGGPNLNNITNFTINWDLSNNGLWQFSVNTNNGIPNWYVDLRSSATWTFNQSQPKITLTNSGFTGLDGQYHVNNVGNDFVMVSATKSFTLYFTNATTAPACTARLAMSEDESGVNAISVGPNPSSENFKLKVGNNIIIHSIQVYDAKGSVMRVNISTPSKNEIAFGEELISGFYLLRVHHSSGVQSFRLIKK